MEFSRLQLTDIFAELGNRLDNFGADENSGRAIERACSANSWFMPWEIEYSVKAVRDNMLERGKLTAWLDAYPSVTEPRTVNVISAGNIPLAGFFDMLCVLICGHRCYYKPAGRDTVLADYIIDLLLDIEPGMEIHRGLHPLPDALIATGSDNSNISFRTMYGDVPKVLRHNRYSAAVLYGNESIDELAGLSFDMFLYSGLGCRNVSHLMVPEGYNLAELCRVLDSYVPNPKLSNSHKQSMALMTMHDQTFIKGMFYTLSEDTGFPVGPSQVTYHCYNDRLQIESWVSENEHVLQLVEGFPSRRDHPLGNAQSPSLNDYPDNIDIMRFLSGEIYRK